MLIKSKIYVNLNHVMQHTLMSEEQLKRAEKMINSFLWKGPRLLPSELVSRHLKEGGLGLIPLKTKNLIMLSQWFRLLRNGGELWCEALKVEINRVGGIRALKRKSPTGATWNKILPCCKAIIEALISLGNWSPKDEYVWGNDNFIPICSERARLARNGYTRVGDFVDADGRIIEAREKNISFAEKMEWVRVTSVIKRSSRRSNS